LPHLPALDDLIDEETWKDSDFENALSRAERLEVGSSFGSVRMDDIAISNDSYYFTMTACNLLTLTQSATSVMKTSDYTIYHKIKRNLREISKKSHVTERVRTEGEESRARLDTQQSKRSDNESGLAASSISELEKKVNELSQLLSAMKKGDR
jgi:hypothetical protein